MDAFYRVTGPSNRQKKGPVSGTFVCKRVKRLELSTFSMARRRSSQLSYTRKVRSERYQTGTAMSFPNNDSVRHHVYSFSPAKTFELKL